MLLDNNTAAQSPLKKYVFPWLRLPFVFAGYLLAGPFLLLRLAKYLHASLPSIPDQPWLQWPGLIIAAVGGYLFLRAWLILAILGKEWPLRHPVLLVKRYIYSFHRHPMYLGYTAFWTGLALWRSSAGLFIMSLIFLAGWLGYVLLVEEPRLARRWGKKYLDYRRKTPLLWPRWSELTHGALKLNIFLLLTMVLMRWLFRLLWRVRVEGQEHVPDEGAFLLVCNHVNLADPFLVGLFLTREVKFMASDELFRKPILKLLFHWLWPAFPKRRWGKDVGALRQAQRMLAAGEPVGIFPEGARNWDGGPVTVGDEVYRFLHHCRVPILTATLIGGHEAFPRWAAWPARARITVRFFPPIKPDQATSHAELRTLAEERIFNCLTEPPVPRTAWRSHRGLPTVTWGCLKCGTPGMINAVKAGIVCCQCGAAWHVTPELRLVDAGSGEILSEREYHTQLRERLARGGIAGGLAIKSACHAFRVVEGKLIPIDRGMLSLDQTHLSFSGAKGILRMETAGIKFAFLNLRNHLVVTDNLQTLEFKLFDSKWVRFEDYLFAARQRQLSLRHPVEIAIANRIRQG